MILVAGGTGRLGSRVVGSLVEQGRSVRVLARGSTEGLCPGAEVVRGDVADDGAVARAVSGVDTVVSAVTGFPRQRSSVVDRDGNHRLVEAAEREGAEVVLVSVVGASPHSPVELMRSKHAAEERVRACAVPWTVLRLDVCTETWVDVLVQSARASRRPVVLGDADNPLGWLSVRDAAALVERTVLDGGPRGRTLSLSGPDRLSLGGLARVVMVDRGWDGAPRRVPRGVLRAAAHTVGAAVPLVGRLSRMALEMDRMPPTHDDAREQVPGLPSTPARTVSAALAREPVARSG